MDPITSVALFGSLYRCRLRYVHVADSDPLSEFILGAIKRSSQYARIDVLTRSFGLPVRIVEDILADLIRTRRAWLDIPRGVIVPIAGAVQRGGIYEDRGSLDLWQDHVTGAILPASMLGAYTWKLDGAQPLHGSGEETFVALLDVSDASLVSLLTRVNPELGFSLDGSWQLDRFVNRVRLGSQVFYLPVRSVQIGDYDRSFVEAPELPVWLTRSWTGKLKHDQAPEDVAPVPAEPLDDRAFLPNALHHAQFQFYAKRWLETAEEVLDINPPPETLQDIRTFNQALSSLQQRLLTTVRFSVSSTPDPPQDSTIIVGNMFPETRRAAKVVAEFEIFGDNFALVDGLRLCFPISTEKGLCWFQIVSHDIGRFLEPVLQRGRRVGGDPIHRVRSLMPRDLFRNVRMGDGSAAHDLLDHLNDHRRGLAGAMQARKLRTRDPEAEYGPSGDADALVQTAEDLPKLSLRASHPELGARLEIIRATLGSSLEHGCSAFTFVDRYELFELLDLIVAEPPGISNLCRIISPLSEESFDDAVVDALKRGIDKGWRFNVCVPRSEEQLGYAQRMRARLSAPHIRFFFTPGPYMPGIVTLNDLIVVGSFKILSDRCQRRLNLAFAIVLQDGVAAKDLADDVDAWPEIHES